MHWRFGPRSAAISGICLIATIATGALIEPSHAQTQPFGAYPLWAQPYLFSGFNAGSSLAAGSIPPAYTTKFGSGTLNLFVSRDDGAGKITTAGSLVGPQFDSPASLQDNWFNASLGNPGWKSSIFGNYKSEPSALFNGLYTTASFGAATIRPNPLGISGLTGFSGGNDATALTARAGLGLQLTPQITIEGSVGFTQMPASGFR